MCSVKFADVTLTFCTVKAGIGKTLVCFLLQLKEAVPYPPPHTHTHTSTPSSILFFSLLVDSYTSSCSGCLSDKSCV